MRAQEPLVSCILPGGPRRFLPPAFECFLRQQYGPRELIVIDDGPQPAADLVPRDERIRYLRLETKLPAGARRNFGCRQARGDVIVHWDADAWHAPHRILYLVNALLREQADLCGFDTVLAYDLRTGAAWRERRIHPSTLCYSRAFWERHPFPDGESRPALERAVAIPDAAASQLCFVHEGNAGEWTSAAAERQPCDAAEIRRLLGRDWRFYGPDMVAAEPPRPVRRGTAKKRGFRQPPLVSCIMPARSPRFAALAIEYFLRQDYEPRELIVVAGPASQIEEVVPRDERIRFVPVDETLSAGARRNAACQQARGKIIAHWDEDDWQAPRRLRDMVATLLRRRGDIAGLNPALAWDLRTGQAWAFRHPLERALFSSGSLCYRRALWERNPFPDADVGEDLRFLWNARDARVLALTDYTCRISMGADSSTFAGPYWHPFPADDIRRLLGADWEFYEPELAPRAAPVRAAEPRIEQPAPAAAGRPAPPQEQAPRGPAASKPAGDHPLVSCIMPTHNRRQFVARAIEYFLRQDYDPLELVVIDDGADPVEDLVPRGPRFRYIRAETRLTVGAKRNLACEQARGGVIVHWDDDDWQAPHRVRAMVDALLREEADLCGLNPVLFYDPRSGKAWRFRYPPEERFWVHGSSFCYRREFWERNRFADADVGEDNQFIWNAPPARLAASPESSLQVCIIHDDNVSPKAPGGGYWQPCPAEEVRAILGGDWNRYGAAEAASAAPAPARDARAARISTARPFDVLSCSWPVPVEHRDGRWLSQPDWSAPPRPEAARARLRFIANEPCWMLDWREYFNSGPNAGGNAVFGDLRGFQVVFRLRARESGLLRFWSQDGCIIRREGKVLCEDRRAHGLWPAEIAVASGDLLEVAQWQQGGEWSWGGRLVADGERRPPRTADFFLPHLERVRRALERPEGPPLKIYTSGRTAARAVTAIYSLILNGYAPSRVFLYGDHQWSEAARSLFSETLPFATVVRTGDVLARLESLGGSALADLALLHWFVMKASVALFEPPEASCLLDDDVFVLGRCDDALAAFERNDLVYMADQDLSPGHFSIWGALFDIDGPLATARFNAGIYWIRNVPDPARLASIAVQGVPSPATPYYWEQGLIAMAYARQKTCLLPEDRYFYPLFRGMPGGVLGYDYGRNPCGFASVHFGGLTNKPGDLETLELLGDILRERGKTNPSGRE